MEKRDCPTAPTLTSFSASILGAHEVQLAGTLIDDNPATVRVDFQGIVTDSVLADSAGNFSLTTSAGTLGTITATATNADAFSSDSLSTTLSVAAPTIIFTRVYNSDGSVTLSGHVTADNPSGLIVNLIGGVNGSLTTDPNGDYSTTVSAWSGGQELAEVTDDWGQVSDSATVGLTSGPQIANPGQQSWLTGDTLSLPIAFTDDTGWPVSFSAVGLPPGLSIDASTGCISGTIYYGAETPSPYTVSVTATDTATQLSDTATFPWTVSALPPVAMDATLTMGRDQILPDIDLNQYVDVGGGDWLSFTIVSQPANGTLTQGGYGIYVYTPNAGFAGTDSFSIQANNGVQDSNVATITIEVAPYAPSAGDGSYAVLANHTLPYIDFSKNDPNAGGDPSAISIVSGPAHGMLSQNGDATYNYKPEAGYVGADTITISTGTDAVTVTINVIDHAPVATQTQVYLQAFNQAYDGIDFLANATDADADAITFNLLSAPQHGTLVYDASTQTYSYVGVSGYNGLDTFIFNYTDGVRASQTVTCQVLDYDASVDVHSSLFEEFGQAPPTALYDNGTPTQSRIQQGQIAACAFIATVASFIGYWPNWTATNLITSNANGTYTVNFPGNAVTVTSPVGDGKTYSPANGDGFWLSVLEKAAGQYYYNNAVFTGSYTPYDYINESRYPCSTIPLLTGNTVDDDEFWCTRNSTTATKLTAAFNANKVVVASTGSIFGAGGGLVQPHSYAVVGWNADTQRVTLFNPWGTNPWYDYTYTDSSGVSRTVRANRGLNGYFTISLSAFTSAFSYIDYEE